MYLSTQYLSVEKLPFIRFRFCCKILSPEARDVIDTATELVRISFADREDFFSEHVGKIKDDYQLNNWDCGYYQLKQLWGEEYPTEFKEFKAKVKALKDKLIPQVYEVGFLRK